MTDISEKAVTEGKLRGLHLGDVVSFRGIPFAGPPVGEWRWKPPRTPQPWSGTLSAQEFGPRPMQLPLFGDMAFRSDRMSEDCLYLNVWAPAQADPVSFPVLVYFYGGGFQAGDSSEPRYDGESMARRGIVVVTVNYRLNVLGFLAHSELTKESSHHASGNYGFLDQQAALVWVHRNIGAFGGDPDQVTIAGESAGSISVSAHMASPLSRDLFAQAIGESGSILGTLTPVALAQAEQAGAAFVKSVGLGGIAQLRALPAEELLRKTGAEPATWLPLSVDGYFFPRPPAEVYASRDQADVPLLAGWNSEEMPGSTLLGDADPTIETFGALLRDIYPEDWEEAARVYHPAAPGDVVPVATDLAGDRFIGYSSWNWTDVQARAGRERVYRYYYCRPRPNMKPELGNMRAGLAGGVIRDADNTKQTPADSGAVHSAEIEYALGNLERNGVYAWTPEDFKVSTTLQGFFENFIKTGNPNGLGLPEWPALKGDGSGRFMRIDVDSVAQEEQRSDRYRFLRRVVG